MSRHGYLSFNGFDPKNGQREFRVSMKQVEHLQKFGPSHRYYELQSVVEALTSPLVVYQGLNREGKESAFCYVGRPRRFGEDWSAPGADDMVFVVCATMDGVVFEWRWEKADEGDRNRPRDVAQRFNKQIWKH